ncbi:MAG: GGDEF domain-containing protein [Clostridia bacterium]|nr:GGDEF domain-containing protein [Clostridia bacterium]
MGKIKELIKKYSSNNLDYSIMCLVLMIMGLLSFVSIISNAAVGYPFSLSFKWIFLFIFSILSLFLVKDKEKMKLIKSLTIALLAFVLIPYAWFSAGGSNSYAIYYGIVSVMLIAIVIRGKKKIILISLIILELEGLMIVERLVPDSISELDASSMFVDSLIQVPVIIVIISVALSMIIRMYKKQQDMIEEYNKRLTKISFTDELAEVHNRRSIIAQLEKDFIKAVNKESTLQILLIDIDNFKYINDTHGHQQGDAVIYTMCKTIKEIINTEGIIGRYGGDEFLIIFNNIDYEKAYAYSEDIRKHLINKRVNDISFSISGGLVRYTKEDSIKQMIYKADILLFEAKKMGKNMIRAEKFNYFQEQLSILPGYKQNHF